MRRREFLTTPVALAASSNTLGLKALAFDVFGTVVDWRGSIIRAGAEWARNTSLHVDWAKFADRWRAGYGPAMDKVRNGTLPWMKLDALHRMILDDVLAEFQITGLSESDKDSWNQVWHRLTPWPDSISGLARLKQKYVLTTLSNGNVSLLVDMAKHAGLPWDAVLSAELFHHYKPDREVYLGAAGLLGCKPAEVMMVAAHVGDLKAARACGLRTGFIYRPNEFGPSVQADTAGREEFDVAALDLLDLAQKLS